MKNLKEIKTTFIGLVFLAVGALYFWYNKAEELTTNDLIFLAVCAAGFVGFLAAPDKILGVFFGWISKK